MTVDILFPYYGDVAMMKQAVLSVVGQTNPDWRMIVIDDGYPDDSIPGWFESLKDERITYMRNEKNLGANGNYRKCLVLMTLCSPTMCSGWWIRRRSTLRHPFSSPAWS